MMKTEEIYEQAESQRLESKESFGKIAVETHWKGLKMKRGWTHREKYIPPTTKSPP